MDMDYEKLGAFYLGKEYDLAQGKILDDLVLYDSKDLNTHAVIVGMTGSGKTGLGIGLIEEALIDNIPVIAIDPKGDITNLLLTFPDLAAADFKPWVDPQEATKKGQTIEQFAAQQAELWRKGLEQWDQSGDRIKTLMSRAQCDIYTPGSSAGIPVNIMQSLSPPAATLMDDPDLLRDRILTTTTSMLTLIGIEADPISSREHILLSNIFEQLWSAGKSLDLPMLIHLIQAPPFDRIGVMDLELFYPKQDRFGLAMRLNNLLASPGFESWLKGDPLLINNFLRTKQGKTKASIFTISHLNERERMFFVSLLLNEILGWIRTQPGTSSLRAILYMDEIFGYFPPVQNPPSKLPLLTLLKQARAYGLGVVLSTQNPVDLDYKGLANAGTWFIGRLQTERDKSRLLAGLEGVTPAGKAGPDKMDETLSALGKRVFYCHNVHEREPIIFHTRWALSYLPGPLTREQIKKLMEEKKTDRPGASHLDNSQGTLSPVGETEGQLKTAPASPPGVDTFFVRATGSGHGLIYYPAVGGRLDVNYDNARYNVNTTKTIACITEFVEGPVAVDWDNAASIPPELIESEPLSDATYSELPSLAVQKNEYKKWENDFKRWVSQNYPLILYRSKRFKKTSEIGQSEADFRASLTMEAREKRDVEVEKIRRKYEKKFTTLKDRLLVAEQAIMREQEQSRSRQLETAVSVGTALLSAFLGRKKVSVSSASRMGSAIKSASRIKKEQVDIERARERADSLRAQLLDMEFQLQEDISRIELSIDPETEPLEEILVKPKSSGLTLEIFGLIWLPYRKETGGKIHPDWT